MGPLFSLLLMVVLGAIVLATAFLASWIVWPWKSAAIVAVSAVALGGIGLVLGLLLQVPFWQANLAGSEPIVYLGIGVLMAVIGAAIGVKLTTAWFQLPPRKPSKS